MRSGHKTENYCIGHCTAGADNLANNETHGAALIHSRQCAAVNTVCFSAVLSLEMVCTVLQRCVFAYICACGFAVCECLQADLICVLSTVYLICPSVCQWVWKR